MADNVEFGNVQLPGRFTENEFRWSYWWVSHRDKVRKIAVLTLLGLDVVLVAIGGFGVVDWLAISGPQEARKTAQLASASYAPAPRGGGAQEIKVDSPLVFSLPGSRYDLVTSVTNANERFWVEFEYRFTLGGKDGPIRQSFILPGSSKRITELGLKLEDTPPSDARLTVIKRSFHRINRHTVPDYQTWSAPRLDLPATGATFTAAIAGATVPTNITSFTLANQTAYTYYDLGVDVFVLRGETLLGANRVSVDRMPSGERRKFDLYWYQNLPGVSRIEVVPDINIFDPDAYKPLNRP